MRPLPSDSTTATVPGLGDGEVRAADRRPARRGTSRAGARGRPRRAPAGSSAERRRPSDRARKSSRISARLRWIAGTRMCDGVSSASWTISSARSVSTACDARRPSALVEPDLVGRHRLDLDHLVARRVPRATLGDHRGRPRRRRAPSARRRRRAVTAASSALELARRGGAARASLIAAPASRSASQSGSSATAARALVADRARRVAEVAAQLACRRARRAPPPGSRPFTRAARISARCIVRTPARWRRSAAADVHQARVVGRRADLGARVEDVPQLVGQHRRRRVGVLDREGPAEAAALLARPAARRGRCPRTARSSRSGASPTLQQPQRVAGRVVGDAVRERRRRRPRRRAGRRGTRDSSNTRGASAAHLPPRAPRRRPRRPAAGSCSRTIAAHDAERRDDRLGVAERRGRSAARAAIASCRVAGVGVHLPAARLLAAGSRPRARGARARPRSRVPVSGNSVSLKQVTNSATRTGASCPTRDLDRIPSEY